MAYLAPMSEPEVYDVDDGTTYRCKFPGCRPHRVFTSINAIHSHTFYGHNGHDIYASPHLYATVTAEGVVVANRPPEDRAGAVADSAAALLTAPAAAVSPRRVADRGVAERDRRDRIDLSRGVAGRSRSPRHHHHRMDLSRASTAALMREIYSRTLR